VEESHGVSTLNPASSSAVLTSGFCCIVLTNVFPFELCIKHHSALFMLRLLKVPKCK